MDKEFVQARPGVARLMPLYGVIIIAFLGYSMMVTLFVPMLMHKSAGFLPENFTTAQRTTLLGLLLALYPLGQFLGCPIIAALSDRFGRKPMLLGSLSITTICYLFICLALQGKSFLLLTVSCLVGGLSESNIAVTQGAIADVTAPSDRGRWFGYIYSACSVSYIVGPIFGGVLAERPEFHRSLSPTFRDNLITRPADRCGSLHHKRTVPASASPACSGRQCSLGRRRRGRF
jgi:MFS family permease